MCSIPTLTSLPAELIQEIAWLSHNPNIYLTCHTIRSRLLPQSTYLQDLTILLLCDRQNDQSAWYAEPLPWGTIPARTWDLNPSRTSREAIQRQVFNLDFITDTLLTSMIRFTLQLWITTHYPYTSTLSTSQRALLTNYINTTDDSAPSSNPSTTFRSTQNLTIGNPTGHKLHLSSDGGMAVSYGSEPPKRTRYVVSMLCVATRLLSRDGEGECNELARVLMGRTRMDSLDHMIVRRRVARARPAWMGG